LPPPSDPRTMRRAGSIRPSRGRRIALPPEATPIAFGLWGLGLMIGLLLQLATPFCDHHPGAATWLAGINLALSLVPLAVAIARQEAQDIALAVAALTLLGAGFVWWAGSACQATLDGTPGYDLPHRPTRFDPTTRDVTLVSSDGVTLRGTYLGHGRNQGVILLPGWASTRHGFAIASLAEWLSTRFDVLVLDPRGQGESDGDHRPDLKDRFDLLAAIAYMNGKGAQQIGVLAEREATMAAIAAMSEQHSIKSLALAGPVGHWGEVAPGSPWWQDPTSPLGGLVWRIGSGVRVSGGHGPDTADLLPKAAGAPILLMGSKDDPQGLLRQLHLIAPEPRSLRLFSMPGQPVAWSEYQDYFQTLAQWFQLTLVDQEKPAAPPPEPEATASEAIALPPTALATEAIASPALAAPVPAMAPQATR